jgi:hypothetical protein
LTCEGYEYKFCAAGAGALVSVGFSVKKVVFPVILIVGS